MMTSGHTNLPAEGDESHVPLFFGDDSFHSNDSFGAGIDGNVDNHSNLPLSAEPRSFSGDGGGTMMNDAQTMQSSSSQQQQSLFAQLQQQQALLQQQQQQDLLLKHQQDNQKQQFWPKLFFGGGSGGADDNSNNNDNMKMNPSSQISSSTSPFQFGGSGGNDISSTTNDNVPSFQPQQLQQQQFSNPDVGHDPLFGVPGQSIQQHQHVPQQQQMQMNPFTNSDGNHANNNFIGLPTPQPAPLPTQDSSANGGNQGGGGGFNLSFLPNIFANSIGFGNTSQVQAQQQNFNSHPTIAPFQSNTIPMPESIQRQAQEIHRLSSTTPGTNVFGAGVGVGGDVFDTGGGGCQSMSQPQSDATNNETDADALLAKELNKLSMKERETINQDIHGVNDVVQETPELINSKMEEFQMKLYQNHNMYPSLSSTNHEIQQERQAYEQALQQDPHFVHHPKLLLQFLRADNFNISDAVNRIYSFFTVKRKLFGVHNLCKHITLTEEFYTPDDIACLKTGYWQILPGRDRSGRAILFVALSLRSFKQYLNVVRAVWYLIMSALEDEETQKKGFIMVGYSHNKQGGVDRRVTWETASLTWTLPMKLMAVHGCCESPAQKVLLQLATFLIGEHNRYRYRIHCGTHLECQYDLMTFGVSGVLLPVTPDGEYKLEPHLDWLERRSKAEKSARDNPNSNVRRIVVPNAMDVLFGRGRLIQEHPGNVRYRHLIETNREEYEKASKLRKTELAKMIVSIIKFGNEEDKASKTFQGGRFLKLDGGGWVEVDDQVSRDKIGHSFRNRRASTNTITTNNHKKKDASTPSRKQNKQVSSTVSSRSSSPRVLSDSESDMSISASSVAKRQRFSGSKSTSPTILEVDN